MDHLKHKSMALLRQPPSGGLLDVFFHSKQWGTQAVVNQIINHFYKKNGIFNTPKNSWQSGRLALLYKAVSIACMENTGQ